MVQAPKPPLHEHLPDAIGLMCGKLLSEGWDRLRSIRLAALVQDATHGLELPDDLAGLGLRLKNAILLEKPPNAAVVQQLLNDCGRLATLLRAPNAPRGRRLWVLGNPTITDHHNVQLLLPLQHLCDADLPTMAARAGDVLITDINWLERLDDSHRALLLTQAVRCTEWIMLCQAGLPFKRQLEWLRQGVNRFIDSTVPPTRLADLLTDICDNGDAEPYRVMVVDDEQSQVALYSALLREAGIQPMGTDDPTLALEYIEEFKPDLLLVDIVMPACSGPELVRLIRQKPSLMYLPVIYITVSGERSHHLDAGRSAAEGLIRKPVDPELLVAQVLSQVRRYRHQCRLERQQAMAMTRLSQIQSAFDQHAIVSITDRDGRMIYANDLFCTITGYTPDEMLGNTHNMFNSGIHSSAFYENLWRTISANLVWHGDVCDRRKNGSLVWFKTTIVPVADERGMPIQFIAIRTDISVIKVAHETAESMSRAKSDFLSSMSHELRTPMNAILGFAQVLEADDALNADQHESVQEILQAGHHLLDLVNEVLDLAKIESGRLTLSIESLAVNALCEECLSMVASMAQARQIRLSFTPTTATHVRADRVRLKQSLINLLSNAIKYNRINGEVRLEITRQNNHEGSHERFTVSDTGIGIPRERLHELFIPFTRLHTTNTDIEGNGIGLALTRRLVELMDGKIGVESDPGKGSRFWIEIPADIPKAPTPPRYNAQRDTAHDTAHDTAAPAHTSADASRRYTVLCIEDNLANQRLISHILARRPVIDLIAATHPEEGIALAERALPDLILLDINLPGMDGYEVIKRLHALPQLAKIPVIAITGNDLPLDYRRGISAGFSAYLTKPIDVFTLLGTLDTLLGLTPPN